MSTFLLGSAWLDRMSENQDLNSFWQEMISLSQTVLGSNPRGILSRSLSPDPISDWIPRQEQSEANQRCHDIILLVITFVERNPGFARLFAGDALQGETERLRNRMCQLLDRIETQLRQVLREHRAQLTELPNYPVNPTAKLMLAVAEGRIQQFVRSDFRQLPSSDWAEQWALLNQGLSSN